MKNSAFAVNPCPRDLLGKQWLFMHMSAHYRKMWSAQSVVDSAAPASLKAKTGTPRSASRPAVRLSQKPSRADTDPGPSLGSSLGNSRPRSGARGGLDGRASSASRRQLEYGASVLRKPPSLARPRRRDAEPSTYYDKLNQLVPDHRAGLRTSGQILSEVFTPRVPHKPQVLRTEVPSRLRFSSTYCPPRAKPIHAKPGVQGQEIGTDAGRPMWTASSPPVSSRDSAYNGGISSGGESRGPTPDQAGVKKHPKRSEKKGKKKADPKRPYSADTKVRRKVENKFMKKLLEDERNELHEQRLRVDPWHGINQDDHGDEILRNMNNLHIESHVDDSLTEHESPANTGSVSGQSIEEDMAEEVDESVEADSSKEADGDDSVIKDESSESVADTEESAPSHSVSKSSPTPNKQISTQTDPPMQRNASKELSSRSQHSPSPTQSTSISTKQSCSRHSTSLSSSHLSNKSSSAEKSRSTTKLQPETEVRRKGSAPLCDAKESKTKQDEKLETNTYLDNDRSNDMSYARLMNMITKDVLEKRVVTYKALKAICDEHIEANCDKLDKERMQQEVDKLQIQLEIPKEDLVDKVDYISELSKREKLVFTSEFIPSPDEVGKFSLLSGPVKQLYQDKNLKTKSPVTEGSPFRFTQFRSAKMNGGSLDSLDSLRKPIIVTDEDSLFQQDNIKMLNQFPGNTMLRNWTGEELTKTTLPPSCIAPAESTNPVLTGVLHPSFQNDQLLPFTPKNYSSQFSKDSGGRKELSADAELCKSSKRPSSLVISTEENESHKFTTSLLSKYEYLTPPQASARDPPASKNETKEPEISEVRASDVSTHYTIGERKSRYSDHVESYMRTLLEENSTMPFIKSKLFKEISLGLNNTADRGGDLNIEMEQSIKEIEKELGQGRSQMEVMSSPEPEIVELFRHTAEVREINSEPLGQEGSTTGNNARTSGSDGTSNPGMEDNNPRPMLENVLSHSFNKDQFQFTPHVQAESNDEAHEKPDADVGGHVKSKISLLSNPLISDASSIPFGTGQNSDILRLKL